MKRLFLCCWGTSGLITAGFAVFLGGCNFMGLGTDTSSLASSESHATPVLSTATSNWSVAMTQDINQTQVHSSLSTAGTYLQSGNLFYFIGGTASTGLQLYVSNGTAAGTTLVKTINPNGVSAQISRMMPSPGGGILFFANDGTHGPQLWFSNGTAAGTISLGVTFDPTASGSNCTAATCSAIVGSNVFFVADDGVHGAALWESNGTPSGTNLVLTTAGTPLVLTSPVFYPAGTFTFIETSTGLWRTDGTAAGTIQLSPDIPFEGESNAWLSPTGQLFWLYVGADVGSSVAYDLWRSDGTVAGTLDIHPAISVPVATNSGTFPPFYPQWAYYNSLNYLYNNGQLWQSDGTATGTSLVADTLTYYYSNATQLSVSNGLMYFATQYAPEPSPSPSTAIILESSPALWVSNGTAAGTTSILGAPTITSIYGKFTPVTGGVVFAAYNPTQEWQPWFTNGTAAGTAVLDVDSASVDGWPEYPYSYSITNGTNGLMLFAGYDPVHGYQPWVTNGTQAGTLLLDDISAPNLSSVGSTMSELGNSGTQLYFQATDPVYGLNLWVTNGTSAGTLRLPTPYTADGNSNSNSLIQIGNTVYFTATTTGNTNTTSIWSSDGTSAGTQLLEDFDSVSQTIATPLYSIGNRFLFETSSGQFMGSDGTLANTVVLPQAPSVTTSITPVKGYAFYCAYATVAPTGAELWTTDGTVAGTTNITLMSTVESCPAITASGNQAFFEGYDPVNGYQLWKSDGTGTGTGMITNVNSGSTAVPPSSNPTIKIAFKGGVLFTATDSTLGLGNTLFYSDGTAANTVALLPLGDGAAGVPNLFTVSGGKAYFTYNDVVHGLQWWVTDGTAAGTTIVNYFTSGIQSIDTVVADGNGNIYFTATDGGLAFLAFSNGTAAGTTKVMTQMASYSDVAFSATSVLNGQLFFFVSTNIGRQLWKSNGTMAGTSMVYSWQGGDTPSFNAHALDNLLIFTSSDAAHGVEMWMSDGTTAGTNIVADVNPGPADSNPAFQLALANGFFFTANDGVHGNELWFAKETR